MPVELLSSVSLLAVRVHVSPHYIKREHILYRVNTFYLLPVELLGSVSLLAPRVHVIVECAQRLAYAES